MIPALPVTTPPTAPPALDLPVALVRDGVCLRAQAEADLPFIHWLYATTRWQELEAVAWTDEQKSAFCLSQSQLQQIHYARHYAGGEFAIIERHGQPIGRLYLFRSLSEIRITDITLAPDWRGRGIGAALLAQVVAEAGAAGQRAVIHVEKVNPAQNLYKRIGFGYAEDQGVHWRMEWPAP